jgi:DNA-binding NtrC family response regulator
MTPVLVVDDLENFRISIGLVLERAGYEVILAGSGSEALEHLQRRPIDVMVTDLRMDQMDGQSLLKAAKALEGAPEVIMMTAYASIGDAVNAIKVGAFDYLTKPFRNEELLLTVQRAVEQRHLKEEVDRLRFAVGEAFAIERIIGRSAPMRELAQVIRKVAVNDSSLLILGESGVGKELVARTIHAISARSGGPFVAVNCGALPESIQETELFGYKRGAFTGAAFDRKGLAEEADRGVLFLDEVGEMTQQLQVKLLRFLQDGEVRRVGDSRVSRVNARVLSATNADVEGGVKSGTFRSDLYYRLNVVSLRVPPLRERKGDIGLLAMHLLEQYAKKYGKPVHGLSEGALAALEDYHWPGNVRELQNVLERAVTFATSGLITEVDLPRDAAKDRSQAVVGAPVGVSLADRERVQVLEAMHKHRWNRGHAAEELGISRTTLWRKLKDYGVA